LSYSACHNKKSLLDKVHLTKVVLKLRVQELRVTTLEDLRDEIPSCTQRLDTDVERSHQQLGLYVLVHIVEACDVGGAVANYQVRELLLEG
jgi:hypothetical protein